MSGRNAKERKKEREGKRDDAYSNYLIAEGVGELDQYYERTRDTLKGLLKEG